MGLLGTNLCIFFCFSWRNFVLITRVMTLTFSPKFTQLAFVGIFFLVEYLFFYFHLKLNLFDLYFMRLS
jgi:hypothetical protein